MVKKTTVKNYGKNTMVKQTMAKETMVNKLWSKARCSVIVFPIFEIVSQALHA